MKVSIAIVCEDLPDRETAAGLAERIILEKVQWIRDDPEWLDHALEWRGLRRSDLFLKWSSVGKLAACQNINERGFFDGKPGKLDSYTLRNALLLLKLDGEKPDAVVFIRDGDDKGDERREGLEQARSVSKKPLDIPIVIGVAATMRECWILAGFEPNSIEERTRLTAIHRKLGFDPTTQARRLPAKDESGENPPKKVLNELCKGDRDREKLCWKETSLSVLKTRGKETGLPEYLEEVEAKLIPLFENRARSA
ncbi:MAG: hypothetical protein NVSMB14_11450 [Isosphaeraceae bacterium]